jgi:methyl-accepting chemotaxis protein
VKRYVQDKGLPFDVLIDDSRDVLRAYDVWHRIGIDAWNIAKPALFLIDTEGIVRYAFVAQWQHEFPGYEEIRGEIERVGVGGWGLGIGPIPNPKSPVP